MGGGRGIGLFADISASLEPTVLTHTVISKVEKFLMTRGYGSAVKSFCRGPGLIPNPKAIVHNSGPGVPDTLFDLPRFQALNIHGAHTQV